MFYQTSEDALYVYWHGKVVNAGGMGAKKKAFVNEDYMQLSRKLHVFM